MFSLDDSAGCQIGPNPCVLRNSSTAFGLWPRVYESEIAGHSSNVIIRELTGQFFVLVPLGSVCVGSLCHGTQAYEEEGKTARQRSRTTTENSLLAVASLYFIESPWHRLSCIL